MEVSGDHGWRTRGWHSKNATFTLRNYFNGATTTTSARRAGIRLLRVASILVPLNQPRDMLAFQRAEEGMEVAISSSKAVKDIYPEAEVMLCGGHAGRALLEKCQKDKMLPSAHIEKYKAVFPVICQEEYQNCKCVGYLSQEWMWVS